MTLPRRLTVTLTSVAALALAACSASEDETAVPQGEPIAAIAAPEGSTWLDTVTVTDSDGYLVGNPEAPIKLIEYASLTCGACANFSANGMEELKQDYVSTGVVSVELRNQIHNGVDLILARLVRCSAPEALHPLSEQVWSNLGPIMQEVQTNQAAMEAATRLPEDQRYAAIAEATGLLDFFAARGLSADQARSCLADPAAVQAIAERSNQQSEELNVTSTPTFIVNGTQVEAKNWAALEPILQRAGAR